MPRRNWTATDRLNIYGALDHLGRVLREDFPPGPGRGQVARDAANAELDWRADHPAEWAEIRARQEVAAAEEDEMMYEEELEDEEEEAPESEAVAVADVAKVGEVKERPMLPFTPRGVLRIGAMNVPYTCAVTEERSWDAMSKRLHESMGRYTPPTPRSLLYWTALKDFGGKDEEREVRAAENGVMYARAYPCGLSHDEDDYVHETVGVFDPMYPKVGLWLSWKKTPKEELAERWRIGELGVGVASESAVLPVDLAKALEEGMTDAPGAATILDAAYKGVAQSMLANVGLAAREVVRRLEVEVAVAAGLKDDSWVGKFWECGRIRRMAIRAAYGEVLEIVKARGLLKKASVSMPLKDTKGAVTVVQFPSEGMLRAWAELGKRGVCVLPQVESQTVTPWVNEATRQCNIRGFSKCGDFFTEKRMGDSVDSIMWGVGVALGGFSNWDCVGDHMWEVALTDTANAPIMEEGAKHFMEVTKWMKEFAEPLKQMKDCHISNKAAVWNDRARKLLLDLWSGQRWELLAVARTGMPGNRAVWNKRG